MPNDEKPGTVRPTFSNPPTKEELADLKKLINTPVTDASAPTTIVVGKEVSMEDFVNALPPGAKLTAVRGPSDREVPFQPRKNPFAYLNAASPSSGNSSTSTPYPIKEEHLQAPTLPEDEKPAVHLKSRTQSPEAETKGVELNSNIIDSNDFMAGSGFRFICELKEDSQARGANHRIIEDWNIIEGWLECKGRNLNKLDKERVMTAWKSYFAAGVAPSLKLKNEFLFFKLKSRKDGVQITYVPSDVKGVFDRLLATDDQIEEKNNFASIDSNKLVEKTKIHNSDAQINQTASSRKTFFTKNVRMFIVIASAWIIYVMFRTSGYYEIFGLELGEWDSDYIALNTLIPPIAIIISHYLFRWINKPENNKLK